MLFELFFFPGDGHTHGALHRIHDRLRLHALLLTHA